MPSRPDSPISPFSYDRLPYSSYPYAHSHPRNLAALAQLFAMVPPDVSQCRVLEIGCASGGNLIPMAVAFPQSEFDGLDASARQIADGQQVIADLSLSNIRLRHQNVLDFDPDTEPYDFIICHGVYSWVPPEVQTKILAVCRDHLSVNGIAYISYNTYPGWYLRRGVREMMSFHAEGFADTQEKIDQSRALVDFLAGAVQPQADAYEKLLHEELSILRGSEDSYIFHEHLEDYNEPVFFHQFVSRAEDHELRFLCEAQFGSMIASDYSEETQATLAKIAPDIVRMEQYMDFLRNRKFRQTLLCHRHVKLDRVIMPERLRDLFVNSALIIQEDESVSETVFDHASGRKLTVTSPLQRAALKHLAGAWPGDVSIEELVDVALQAVPVEERPSREVCCEELYETFLELFSASLVSLFASPSGCVAEVGAMPRVSPLTRYQAKRGGAVTNCRHETVRIDEFEREILTRLNGCQTIDQLTEQLRELSVKIQTGGEDAASGGASNKPTHQELRAAIENSLSRLAQTALLITPSQAKQAHGPQKD